MILREYIDKLKAEPHALVSRSRIVAELESLSESRRVDAAGMAPNGNIIRRQEPLESPEQ